MGKEAELRILCVGALGDVQSVSGIRRLAVGYIVFSDFWCLPDEHGSLGNDV
jgi:hypothetical protein